MTVPDESALDKIIVDLCVCARVDDLKAPVLGSTQMPCVGCGELLWLGPTSGQIVHRKGIPTICKRCLEAVLYMASIAEPN
jgi:hypothetical protein